MGFPLSRFHTLYNLCQQGNKSHQEWMMFKKSKLVGIILHDPDDQLFKHSMEDNFNYLDQTTTENFLFMTFIDKLPKDWIKRKNFFPNDHFYDKDCKENFCFATGRENPDFIYKLKRQLDLEGDLPVIVLTNNLMSNEFDVLSTSESKIIYHLMEIGRFCCQYGGDSIDLNDKRYQNFTKGLDPDIHHVTTKKNLSETLLETLAPFAQNDRKDEASKLAKDYTYKVLSQRSNLLDELKNDESSTEDSVIKATIDVSAYLASMLPKRESYMAQETIYETHDPYSHHSQFPSDRMLISFTTNSHESWSSPHEHLNDEGARFHIDETKIQGAEDASRNFISDYNTLCHFIFNSSQHGNNGIPTTISDQLRTFNFLTINLSSFFENEINHSIVQLMRKCMGIPMPESYYTYWESAQDFTLNIGEKRKLFLNKKNSLPAMGDSLYGWRKMMENTTDYPEITSCGDKQHFDNNWYRIMTIRNNAAHYQPADIHDLTDCYKTINNILNYHFPAMVRLKNSLRRKQISPAGM